MIRYRLSYLTSLLLLFVFTVVFFSVDFFMPHLREWKSNKMLLQSKVYLDESIDEGSGLLEDGIRKAKIAFLLNPESKETFENYNLLLFRTNPSLALENWSTNLQDQGNEIEKRINLFDKSLATLRDDTLTPLHRKRAGEVAFSQMKRLTKSDNWIEDPKNALMVCNLLAETGNQLAALEQVKRLLQNYPEHPQALFLLTRLSVHLKDMSQLPRIGQELARLSAQRDETGLEAIRHMTLLHLMHPLSTSSLDKCIELLHANKHAQPIDFLRIHALRFVPKRGGKKRNNQKLLGTFRFERRHRPAYFFKLAGSLTQFSRIAKLFARFQGKSR
jgi:tetratricopeptide (TPR) repeat protein